MLHRSLTVPLLAGSLLASCAAAAFAQTTPAESAAPSAQTAPAPGAGAAHMGHKNRMMAALQGLQLSDDQKTKIESAMTAFRESRDSATPETRKELRGQIEQVLTPEQRTQFATEMKAHGRRAMSAPSPS